jgi:hypothetical protein
MSSRSSTVSFLPPALRASALLLALGAAACGDDLGADGGPDGGIQDRKSVV